MSVNTEAPAAADVERGILDLVRAGLPEPARTDVTDDHGDAALSLTLHTLADLEAWTERLETLGTVEPGPWQVGPAAYRVAVGHLDIGIGVRTVLVAEVDPELNAVRASLGLDPCQTGGEPRDPGTTIPVDVDRTEPLERVDGVRALVVPANGSDLLDVVLPYADPAQSRALCRYASGAQLVEYRRGPILDVRDGADAALALYVDEQQTDDLLVNERVTALLDRPEDAPIRGNVVITGDGDEHHDEISALPTAAADELRRRWS